MTTEPLVTPTDTLPVPWKVRLRASMVPELLWVVLPVAYTPSDWLVCVGAPMLMVLALTDMLTAPVADKLDVAGAGHLGGQHGVSVLRAAPLVDCEFVTQKHGVPS